MPRFVILLHEFPRHHARDRHWDFMLEDHGVLLTWALSKSPDSVEFEPCEKLVDHRLKYLQYEGPIAHDRGSVSQWDQGLFDFVVREESPGRLCGRLFGDRLNGQFQIRQMDARWHYRFVATSTPVRS